MLKNLIGKQSSRVKNRVERGAVKKFAEAVGDLHPLYLDEEIGLQSIYRGNIAPPTFPQIFDYGVIEGFDIKTKGLIHGEQTFHYKRPLLVGEELFCYFVIEKYTERKGSKGTMGILVLHNIGEDIKGDVIFSSLMTIIITEEVRRVMNVENS